MNRKVLLSAIFLVLLLPIPLYARVASGSSEFEVTEEDLGVVHYTQAPKTWTVNIPSNFTKVETGHYDKNKPAAVNKYGGWEGYLKVNGEIVWKFKSWSSDTGGIVYDATLGKDVRESTGHNLWIDATNFFKAGSNTITYYHFTGGDGIGVKLRIYTTPTPTPPGEEEEPVVKPKVGYIPEGWSLSDESPHGAYEGEYDPEGAGMIEYTDTADSEVIGLVQIYYERAPEITWTADMLEAKAVEIFKRDMEREPDDSGIGEVPQTGGLAGYATGFDREYEVYDLTIIVIMEPTFLDIYACYVPTAQEEEEVTALVNSIYVEGEKAFTISASPESQSIIPGQSTTYIVTVSSVGGFSSRVDLSISGLPSAASYAFDPPSVTPPSDGSAQSTLTIYTDSAVEAGTCTLTITGISGELSRSCQVELTISAAARAILSVSVSPSSVSMSPGTLQKVTYTFVEGAGVGATLTSRSAVFYAPDGTALSDDISPYANDIRVEPLSSAEWEDDVYLPPEVAERAYAAGIDTVILRQSFYGKDDNGNVLSITVAFEIETVRRYARFFADALLSHMKTLEGSEKKVLLELTKSLALAVVLSKALDRAKVMIKNKVVAPQFLRQIGNQLQGIMKRTAPQITKEASELFFKEGGKEVAEAALDSIMTGQMGELMSGLDKLTDPIADAVGPESTVGEIKELVDQSIDEITGLVESIFINDHTPVVEQMVEIFESQVSDLSAVSEEDFVELKKRWEGRWGDYYKDAEEFYKGTVGFSAGKFTDAIEYITEKRIGDLKGTVLDLAMNIAVAIALSAYSLVLYPIGMSFTILGTELLTKPLYLESFRAALDVLAFYARTPRKIDWSGLEIPYSALIVHYMKKGSDWYMEELPGVLRGIGLGIKDIQKSIAERWEKIEKIIEGAIELVMRVKEVVEIASETLDTASDALESAVKEGKAIVGRSVAKVKMYKDQAVTGVFKIVEGVRSIRFDYKVGSDVDLNLISPSGVRYEEEDGHVVVENPEPGTWMFMAIGKELPEAGEDVTFYMSAEPMELTQPMIKFKTTNLSISPTEVKPGEAVTITAGITNVGELGGTYTVSLKINGVVEKTREVTLTGGATETVSFRITKDVVGTYDVEVDGQTGTYKVTAVKVTAPPPYLLYMGGIIGVAIVAVAAVLIRRRRRMPPEAVPPAPPKPMVKVCPYCGAEVPAGALFCDECGRKL